MSTLIELQFPRLLLRSFFSVRSSISPASCLPRSRVFTTFSSLKMPKKPVNYLTVDAFTDTPFKGNPAAVCFLEEEKEDKWLQAVAAEFNLAETCYLTPITPSDATSPPRYGLRYFTPFAEISLCGHATLAASHAIFTSGSVNSNIVEFSTLSGILTVKKVPVNAISGALKFQNSEHQDSYYIELDFPLDPPAEFDFSDISQLTSALGVDSIALLEKTMRWNNLFVVVPSWESVTEILPKFEAMKNFPGKGIILSAAAPPRSGFDFYSRYFCPKLGYSEDPVCGSAHCALAYYWSKKLGKNDFVAYAAFPNRGGVVNLHFDEENQRVLLRGKAVTVMEGRLLG